MTGKAIGEAARGFGLNSRTLRYVEALHLLPTPARSEAQQQVDQTEGHVPDDRSPGNGRRNITRRGGTDGDYDLRSMSGVQRVSDGRN